MDPAASSGYRRQCVGGGAPRGCEIQSKLTAYVDEDEDESKARVVRDTSLNVSIMLSGLVERRDCLSPAGCAGDEDEDTVDDDDAGGAVMVVVCVRGK